LPVGGLLVGAVVGLLVSTSGGKQWTSRREIYLGNPLENGTALTSAPTSLALASSLVTSVSTLRQVASVSGLPVSRLRRNVSFKLILGPAGTVAAQPPPLFVVSVSAAEASTADRAADDLARLVVAQFRPFTRTKLQIAEVRLAQEEGQVRDINRRLTHALNSQSALARSAANQPLVSEYAQTVATLANERSMLDSDISAFKTLISQTNGVESPRVVSSTRSASKTRSSRTHSVVIGALIGLLLGLLAAIFWRRSETPAAEAQTSPPEQVRS
jgi:hypothetical protein